MSFQLLFPKRSQLRFLSPNAFGLHVQLYSSGSALKPKGVANLDASFDTLKRHEDVVQKLSDKREKRFSQADRGSYKRVQVHSMRSSIKVMHWYLRITEKSFPMSTRVSETVSAGKTRKTASLAA